MPRLVMKFGGTSVADVERIRNVARHVKREVEAGHEVAVVVSAMAGKTNELVAWCKEALPLLRCARIRRRRRLGRAGDRRPAGHRAAGHGHPGPLLAGLADPDPDRRRARLGPHRRHRRRGDASRASSRAQVAVVAGFQGVDQDSGRITTLGRGGSDTSAVALAAALEADRCDIYTDVDGVYTTDPRIVPKARRLDKVAFEEMLEMASLGAKVLQVRSVELAMVHKVRDLSCARRFDDPARAAGRAPSSATRRRSWNSRSSPASPIRKDEAQITLRNVADKPGVAAAIFVPLADANINVDMIVQVVSDDSDHDRHHLHRADGRFRARPSDARRRARRASASPSSRARPTWSRSRRSASACAAMPASRRRPSRRWPRRASTSARSPPRRSSSRC